MADTQMLQVAEDTLIDIEVPMPPGIDWLGVLSVFGWGLLAVLIVLLLGTLVWFVWRRAQLYWRLERLKRTLAKSSSEASAVPLYQALQSAKHHNLLSPDAEAPLKQAIDQACFGPQSVSRETLSSLIETFQAELKAVAPSMGEAVGALSTRVGIGLKRFGMNRANAKQTLRGKQK